MDLIYFGVDAVQIGWFELFGRIGGLFGAFQEGGFECPDASKLGFLEGRYLGHDKIHKIIGKPPTTFGP